MKVYVCIYTVYYESEEIKAVFDSLEKAEKWVIENTESDTRTGRCYEWEEWEVK